MMLFLLCTRCPPLDGALLSRLPLDRADVLGTHDDTRAMRRTTDTPPTCGTGGTPSHRGWRWPAGRVPRAGSGAAAAGRPRVGRRADRAAARTTGVRSSCAHLLVLLLLCAPRFYIGAYFIDESP